MDVKFATIQQELLEIPLLVPAATSLLVVVLLVLVMYLSRPKPSQPQKKLEPLEPVGPEPVGTTFVKVGGHTVRRSTRERKGVSLYAPDEYSTPVKKGPQEHSEATPAKTPKRPKTAAREI